MNLNQLIYLKTIAETNSISQASQKLFVSQQAISKSIRALEKEYNTTFLERTTHGVSLTNNGKYAVEIANQILLLNDQMHVFFSQNGTLAGEITIASSSYHFSNYFFPEIFVDFAQKYPDIHLQHSTMTSGQAIQAALDRSADIVFFNMSNSMTTT